jgi:hypothetical protein
MDDGYDPDLEIDAADVLHLGFRRAGAIHHATWNGSAWDAELVVPAPSGTSSLGAYEMAIDPLTDEITIVYADTYGIRFGRRTGGGWVLGDLIELYPVTEAALGLSFAFDGAGTPHAFYASGTEVHHATRDASGWSVEVVGSPYAGFGRSSMVIDASGRPHVAYFARRLYYATRGTSSWTWEVVDESGWVRGMYPSIALDASNRPRISYHDHGEDDLRYAQWNGSDWDREIVDYFTFYRGGSWTQLLLDSTGLPVIAHQGWSSRDTVRYSRFDGSTWTHEVLDRAPTTPSSTNRSFGLFIQMVRDSRGTDHLVYQHRYLSSSGMWVNEIYYTRR